MKLKNFKSEFNDAVDSGCHKYFIAALMFASFAVSFFHAGQSLWFDELFSAVKTASALPVTEVVRNASLFDTWPPLYYVMLHYVQTLFGNSEIVLRLPSIAAYKAHRAP